MSAKQDDIGQVGAELAFELDALPMEVTDYAFDQFADRLASSPRDALETVSTESHLAYESQTALFGTALISEILASACYEKLNDMKSEITQGIREDFTHEQIRAFRSIVDEELVSRRLGSQSE